MTQPYEDTGSARVGRVQTVRGLVDPAELGPTMMHEHLLLDSIQRLTPPPEYLGAAFQDAPVTAANRADVVHHPFTNRDDLVLDDEDLAIAELAPYRAAGGGTIVDTTTVGIGRNPLALRRVSEATGVHVTMGAGFYAYMTHPDDLADRSEDDIAAEIIHDIDIGLEDGIRCGQIGEIGCEGPTETG